MTDNTEYLTLTETSRLAVTQDVYAEDPRGWTTSVDVLCYNSPGYGGYVDDLGDCKTKLGSAFTVVYGNTGDDSFALKVALRYKSVFGIKEDIETSTLTGYSQGDWRDVVAVSPEGYGTAKGHLEEFNAWLWGDVSCVALERAVTWHREGDDDETMTTWEEVDSIGGGYFIPDYTPYHVALEHFPLNEEETAACGYATTGPTA